MVRLTRKGFSMIEMLIFLFIISIISFTSFILIDFYRSTERLEKGEFIESLNKDIYRLSFLSLSRGSSYKFDLNNKDYIDSNFHDLSNFKNCRPFDQVNSVFKVTASGEFLPIRLICKTKYSEIKILISENGIIKEFNG